jgi:hypothetical protein
MKQSEKNLISWIGAHLEAGKKSEVEKRWSIMTMILSRRYVS